MGLPMVQVFMIIARQLSRPVADMVMSYGKDHPLFRNRLLIPVGKKLVNWSTRLRMKNLGLGSPKNLSNVTEAAALEQASEFVQQLVIFGYSCVVVYVYLSYSKSHEKEKATEEDLLELKQEINTSLVELNQRIDVLQAEVRSLSKPATSSGWGLRGRTSPTPAPANPAIRRAISEPQAPIPLSAAPSRKDSTRRNSSSSTEIVD
uniref:OPA3-like protein n=1 Tax=Ditylenchus dipsaci TaxID=166011 RepID=A0A915DJ04_9BILA